MCIIQHEYNWLYYIIKGYTVLIHWVFAKTREIAFHPFGAQYCISISVWHIHHGKSCSLPDSISDRLPCSPFHAIPQSSSLSSFANCDSMPWHATPSDPIRKEQSHNNHITSPYITIIKDHLRSWKIIKVQRKHIIQSFCSSKHPCLVELHPTLGILGDTLIRWSSMQRCLNLQPQTCHLGINSLPEIYGMSLEMVYDVYGIGFTTLMDIYGIGFTTFMDIVIHILNIGIQASTRSSVSNWCHISPATAWGATWCNCFHGWPMGD